MSSTGPQDAPQDWRGVIKHLGPGLIITACIVGSGELIHIVLKNATSYTDKMELEKNKDNQKIC